jgi:hypothetical protein
MRVSFLRFQHEELKNPFGMVVGWRAWLSEPIAASIHDRITGGRIMNRRGFWLGLAIGTISTCLLGQWVFSAASKETDAPRGISPDLVANYVHSVVQAERTFYTTEVVDRLQRRGVVSASEHWKETGDLPLPAQFLLESGRLVAQEPNGIQYRLISSWAINKKNGPATEFERAALTKIVEHSDRPYAGVTTIGKARVFQALYPDKALTHTCADCHNVHPKSPKRDFKQGDVMGGILVTIPLSK